MKRGNKMIIKKLFKFILAYPVAVKIIQQIEREEVIKKKCKEGTLSIWDLI